jgi:16S rRNA (cytosine967-C5)-methyltransferase
MKNAREAAFKSLLDSYEGLAFIQDSLAQYKPSKAEDFNFAREVAYGTVRMSEALDYLAEKLSGRKRLKLKPKERLLIQMAIYQYYFMDRIPIYAIVNETVSLAHKYCHSSFVGFLNAILRKLPTTQLHLPTGESAEEKSIRYSYPVYFVKLLQNHYGKDKTDNILECGNKPARAMVRIRKGEIPVDLALVCEKPFPISIIDNPLQAAESPNYYIQNATPATLIGKLCEQLKFIPQYVVDVCASPGGKAIAIHDVFPNAQIQVNDVSEEKLKRIKENSKKFDIHFFYSLSQGEKLTLPHKVDLIVLDVPCSNSGVLNKRPEARWRISKEQIKDLNQVQFDLLKQAVQWVKPEGQIWYMTCSILPEENEKMVQRACEELGLVSAGFQITFLPNSDGWDGGFAANLRLK